MSSTQAEKVYLMVVSLCLIFTSIHRLPGVSLGYSLLFKIQLKFIYLFIFFSLSSENREAEMKLLKHIFWREDL